MVVCLSGVVTRLARRFISNFFRVWCGVHHLDLAGQAQFDQHVKESLYDQLTALGSYFRRQTNLKKPK